MFLGLATLALEELSYHRYTRLSDRVVLCLWALLENLGYRQLTVVWRLKGLLKYLRGKKDWGVMERRGLNREGSSSPAAPARDRSAAPSTTA